MADETSSNANPFDVRTIRHLVTLMSRHDLSEIDLRQGNSRLRLRRGMQGTVTLATSNVPLAPAAVAPPVLAPATPPSGEAEKPTKNLTLIKSPGPGTFYNREKPEATPYVTVGTRVTPTTVVGLIEAMKLFSEIYADCSGVVVEVVAENGQPVEYGTVLFKIDPAG